MNKKKWSLVFENEAKKQFKKLDKTVQRHILQSFESKILCADDPKVFSKSLLGDLFGLYRFRIGDYRLICFFIEDALVITAVNISHRKDIYLKINRK